MDKVLVPVHVNKNHWCLAVINLRDTRFEYHDPMGGRNDRCLKVRPINSQSFSLVVLFFRWCASQILRRWLVDEWKDKKSGKGAPSFDVSKWEDFTPGAGEIPRQENGSDCGVFMCTFAEYQSRDKPYDFRQGDMNYFRKRMMLELVDGRLYRHGTLIADV